MGKIEIRAYDPLDFDDINGWWDACGERGPLPGCMVEDGTLVADLDGEPVMSLTVLLTQSRQAAYFEGYIARPGLDRPLRNAIGALLWARAYEYAADHGYENVIIYAQKPRLVERYETLGMHRSLSGLTALYRRF